MIGVAGTSPAMTRIYVLIQNDRNPLDLSQALRERSFPEPAMRIPCEQTASPVRWICW
jgi:hypothetical protein